MSRTRCALTQITGVTACLALGVLAHAASARTDWAVGVVGEAEGALATGARAAAEEVNAGGGVGGRTVKLVHLPPSRPWADGPSRLAHMVFQQDVVALLGPTDAASAHVAAQIATRRRIPVITLSPEDSLTRAGVPWVLRGVPADSAQAQAGLEWALREPRDARAAVAVPRGRVGRERYASLIEACRELGVHVVRTVHGADDVRPPPDEIDVLLLWLDPEPALAMLDLLGQERLPYWVVGSLRLDAPAFAHGARHPLALPSLRTGDGSTSAACDGAPHRLPGSRLTDSSLSARLGYDMLWALASAARRAGPDPEALRDELLSGCSLAGQSGHFYFDSNGNRRGDFTISVLQTPEVRR